jgi:3-oxoadipate enol-lactonase
MMTDLTLWPVGVRGGKLAVYLGGDAGAPPVVFNHAILTSSAMWREQFGLLVKEGWRVIGIDTRGHGASDPMASPYSFADLVADNIAVLDRLEIARAHFVGLSLGGMTGMGLGLAHPDRLLSLCLCDMRADAPLAFAASWDERIALAERQGTAALAAATAERWFGKAFLEAHPSIAQWLMQIIGVTSVAGFVGCARAIQGLDYLGAVSRITTPTTLIVGANDSVLPEAMRDIHDHIRGSVFEVIPSAGHLPNIDQRDVFDAALLRHLRRVAG